MMLHKAMKESNYIRENRQIIEKLRNLPVLKNFSYEDLKGFLKLSKLKEYEAGESIIVEGQFDNWLFFLLSGKVKVVKGGVDVCTMEKVGDVFGEMAIIRGEKRSASVIALNNVVCLAVDASYIDELSGDDKMKFTNIVYRIFASLLGYRLNLTTAELIGRRGRF